MLASFQTQIDALNGIDTSVRSVATAVNQLTFAMAEYARAQAENPPVSPGTAGSGGSTGGGSYVPGGGTSAAKPKTEMYWDARNQRVYYGQLSSNSADRGFVDYQTSTAYYDNGTVVPGYDRAEVQSWIDNLKQLGYVKYAKGGMFTNGIVSEPTMFNAGLMGEAGPEAIMPLTRGVDGSLGVVSHGGSQEAIVAKLDQLQRQQEANEQQIAVLLSKVAKSTEETRKLLDEVVRGGEPISVNSEIVSY